MRQNYLEFITVTVEGMPVKRQEFTTNKPETTEEDLKSMTETSPAFRRRLWEILEEAERAAEAS
jgi:hypothetical protein